MKVEIEISGTSIEANAKKQSLEQLAKLNSQTLSKLAELSTNAKAVKAIENPPLAMKLALGIK
ncbi:MAG: hypothetical protein RLZ77_1436 [Bacteroidota bacterium]|jgi:hypothetical protein